MTILPHPSRLPVQIVPQTAYDSPPRLNDLNHIIAILQLPLLRGNFVLLADSDIPIFRRSSLSRFRTDTRDGLLCRADRRLFQRDNIIRRLLADLWLGGCQRQTR